MMGAGTVADAKLAIEAFIAAITEARNLAARGVVGAKMDELLLHAKELLDIVDESLSELNARKYRDLFEAAPILRAKLEALRDELRGGKAH
jgi:hypothetical protein